MEIGIAQGRMRALPKAQAPLRHSLATRLTHWVFSLSFVVLVMSGLQIFNAAPYLDASELSNPAHRVLAIGTTTTASGATVGTTTILGHSFTTTGWLGVTADGMGGTTERAFPGWITFPGYQDLADGRRWHFFFAWIMLACGVVYLAAGGWRRDLAKLIVRPSDLRAAPLMALYYLRLRKEPPPYEKYNPLQKIAYTSVLFVLTPLVILTGLVLSPGVDSALPWLMWVFGGRQFARLWHFVSMLLLLGFLANHLVLVAATGVVNNLRGMIAGRDPRDAVAP
ncbi:MAG: cytochrome b/b6 domain-containing protein [Vulcanimicrobiaceae bacterium]